MSTTFQIAIAQFKSLLRNLKSTAIIFVLPVAFMGIFGLAFGSDESTVYDIGLIKTDSEIYQTVKDDVIASVSQDDDSSQQVFNIIEFDKFEDALIALEDTEISAILQIPDDYIPGRYTTPVIITGIPTDQAFGTISAALRSIFGEYLRIEANYINIQFSKEYENNKFSSFDYIAPGMMVYGILILLPNVASNFVTIIDKKYIFRYFTSKAKSWEIILGNTIYQMVIAIINIVLLYVSARLFGFSAEGSVWYGLLFIFSNIRIFIRFIYFWYW